MASTTPTVATLSKYPPYVSGHAMQAYWNGLALADATGHPQHQVTYNGPVPAEFVDPRILVHQVIAAPGANPKVLDGHLEKALAATLVDLAVRSDVDVLLSYYADPHAGITARARRTLRRLGVPVTVVSSLEGSDLTDSLQRHVDDREAAVIASDLLDADVLLAVSRYVAGEFVATVRTVFGDEVADTTEARMGVRHPGLPPSSFVAADSAAQAAFRRAQGIPGECEVVSTYVRLVPEKGVRHLLDVAERLATTAPGLRMVIAGDGPLREELLADITRRGLSTVHLLGHLEPHEAAVLRSTSVLGMFPSRPTASWNETFGISPLEYQALGVPVLVSETGGTAEATADERFLLPLDADAGVWADAAVALLGSCEVWGPRAREFASAFTDTRAAGTILAAVEGHRRGPGRG